MEKAMAPHSSTLAWKIPWTEEPGGLQSLGSQRVRHDWATSFFFFLYCSCHCAGPAPQEGKWQSWGVGAACESALQSMMLLYPHHLVLTTQEALWPPLLDRWKQQRLSKVQRLPLRCTRATAVWRQSRACSSHAATVMVRVRGVQAEITHAIPRCTCGLWGGLFFFFLHLKIKIVLM